MGKLAQMAVLGALCPLLLAAAPAIELSWPEAGAELSGVSLEVRGSAKGIDAASHVVVAQLNPLGRSASWSRAVLARTAPAPDGSFTLRLYDFVSGKYRLTVWAEPTVGGPRKGQAVRTLSFELQRPRLELVDVDTAEGLALNSDLPTQVPLKLRASPGSRIAVEIDGERVAQAHLEGPEKTLMLPISRPRSLVVVEARNIVFDASSETFELRVNPPDGDADGLAPDLAPLVDKARKLCAGEAYAEASPLLLQLQHAGGNVFGEDKDLGLCAVRSFWQSNDCWAAIPLTRSLLGVFSGGLVPSELRVVRAECELQERRRAEAVTSFGHLIRDIAQGRVAATPQIAARIADGAVDAAPNPKAANAALAPCKDGRGSCILIRKIGALAMARHFTGRLGLRFERGGCYAKVRDAQSKVIKRIPESGKAREGTTWVSVPVGSMAVEFSCRKSSLARYEVVLPRGGSAMVPPPKEEKPLVTIRVTPSGGTLLLDGEERPGTRGVYIFNRGDSVSTLPLRIDAPGRLGQRALVRLNRIPGELSFYLPSKKAMAHYDAGIEARRQGSRQKALAELNKALAIESSYTRAQLIQGLVYQERAQYDAAARAFQRCISLNNDSRDMAVALLWHSALELDQWIRAQRGKGPPPARSLPEVVVRLRKAQDEIAALYQAMPSLNDDPVAYRDDSIYWLARGLYVEYRHRLSSRASADEIEQSLIEALAQWGRVPGQIMRINGARRVSYPSPYQAEKKRVVAELQAAWSEREGAQAPR